MSVHWGGKGPGHVSRWPKAVGPVNTYSGATMLLDFLNPVLDPRITFSRGTNATLIDSTGKLTYAPNNLLTWSEDFSNAAWTKTGATVTANAAIAPDGTLTADQVVFASGTSEIFQAAGSGGAAIGSVWVKGTAGQTIQIYDAYTLKTPTVLTGDWQRLSVPVLGAIRYLDISAGNGSTARTIFLWGAQLEAVTYQTTPSTYVATTASAYYGPRFDYDPVTLAPRGLLIEEARTNLLTYSEQFDNATGWPTPLNITITANVTASPDGTVNADRFDDGTTAAVQHRLFRGSVTFTATAHTYSIFVKAGTGAWFQLVANDGTTGFYANFNAATGALGNRHASATSTITNFGNGWYRCTMTITTAAGTGNAQIGMLDADTPVILPSFTGANRTLFFYGAQLEAGAFATSYIPTVASTVSRSADVATMTGTNFSSWYNAAQGTFVAEATTSSRIGTNPTQEALINLTSSLRLTRGAGSAAIGWFLGSTTFMSSGVTAPSALVKSAGAYIAGNNAASTNGAAVTTDAGSTYGSPTQFDIGNIAGGSFLNGHIRSLAYYNTRLPNTQLQTLTAPSLAAPLALDFISPTYTVGY